jgi:hypothetical protein
MPITTAQLKARIKSVFGEAEDSTGALSARVDRLFRRTITYRLEPAAMGLGIGSGCGTATGYYAAVVAASYASAAAAALLERVVFTADQACTVKSITWCCDKTFSVCSCTSASHFWTQIVLRRRNNTTSVSATAAVSTLKSFATSATSGEAGSSGRVFGSNAHLIQTTTVANNSLAAGDCLTWQVSKTKAGALLLPGVLKIAIEED